MKHQDFELYAEEKPFGPKMPETWASAFRKVTNAYDCEKGELKVLDVGCGDGRIYPFLLNEGLVAKNIHGVEVSHARIDRCNALGWKNAKYIASGSELPYKDGTFHIINFMEVVEHVPLDNIDAVLYEIRRVLIKDGVLLITTPNYPIKRFYDIYAAMVHGKKERWHDDPTHIALYNHSKLKKKLQHIFTTIKSHPFKNGFLYKYIPHPFFMHKIFFECNGKNDRE